MMKSLLLLFVCLAVTALCPAQAPTPVSTGKETQARSAVPVEPIATIVEAFESHPIVAIGNVEFRGDEQCHTFILSLIHDPRFTAVVNDILVEFGNARYQAVVDRFVQGEEVPYELLRRVWQDTTQVEYEWDLPIYEDFFRAVRTVNSSLPRARQLRGLLGDSPIDWDNVLTLEDLHREMADRDGNATDLLLREVLNKGRHALLIYGGQHLIRRNMVPGAADKWAGGIVARLEKENITHVFTIFPETRRDLRELQPDVASWPTPSLAILRGTILGSATWGARPDQPPIRMEEQFDAILYLGPPSSMTMSKLSPALCSDRSYMEMRLRRLNLLPSPLGATFTPANQLKDYCSHAERTGKPPTMNQSSPN